MLQRFVTGLLTVALVGACGGKGGHADAPRAEPTCDAAAAAVVRTTADTLLADHATPEQRPAADAHMTTALTAACTETAWTPAQRACFVAATTQDATRECTGQFEAAQTERWGDKLLEVLNELERKNYGASSPGG